MKHGIAIVGMACEYPDASTPTALWENVLAGRRSFRRIPDCRLNLDDYFSQDPQAADKTYCRWAALIEGYEFDRRAFRIPARTYRAADMTHWLALDVASRALADACFPSGEDLPRARTGVLLGNSLTGEFSRAGLMRLRWPYVRRVVDALLREREWDPPNRREFLEALADRYRQPFPAVDEETLAGGLANTIAGRICNYFDLKGGGYTTDGACASSLLAVAQTCAALTAGDLDVGLAGGVDLSLDPFELVGFAKTGALSKDPMRIYDRRSSGFWPGEGCGMVVLMRLEDALAQGREVYAAIRGWGISSDGKGGLTRPETEGQKLALERAYRRAGMSADAVALFEGHGTGTAVGDAIELQSLDAARGRSPSLAAIGSVKANIGHTKAAAGVAGLIKCVMALKHRILPPMTGCSEPNPLLLEKGRRWAVLRQAREWPENRPSCAAVSAMGFGGINAHLVLEGGPSGSAAKPATARFPRCLPETEFFVMSTGDRKSLGEKLAAIQKAAPQLSFGEMGDLAADLCRQDRGQPRRLVLIADAPDVLARKAALAAGWLEEGISERIDVRGGIFLGSSRKKPRIGFLFPGQGGPVSGSGGALSGLFSEVEDAYTAWRPEGDGGDSATWAQPALVLASLAGMRLLRRFGLEAAFGIGHSIGELAALAWAGAIPEDRLVSLAAERAGIMAAFAKKGGAMASLATADIDSWAAGTSLTIAAVNGPARIVVSGSEPDIEALIVKARENGVAAVRMAMPHAFHSSWMHAAVPEFEKVLAEFPFSPPQRTAISTVTGAEIDGSTDLRSLLARQITAPVLFRDAVTRVGDGVDLWLEVGSGNALSGLVRDMAGAPAISLEIGGASVSGWFAAVGAAYVLGADVSLNQLFADRPVRSFDLEREHRFFSNPCEEAPRAEGKTPLAEVGTEVRSQTRGRSLPMVEQGSTLDLVRDLVSVHTDLPFEEITADLRLMADLHVNSLAIAQIAAEARSKLGLRVPVSTAELANATVAEMADALQRTMQHGAAEGAQATGPIPGIAPWLHAFGTVYREEPLAKNRSNQEFRVEVMTPKGQPPPDWFGERAGSGRKANTLVGYLVNAEHDAISSFLLRFAQTVREQAVERWLLVHDDKPCASFARCLYLETPKKAGRVLCVDPRYPDLAGLIAAEAGGGKGFEEAVYDDCGRRRVPRIRPLARSGNIAPKPALGPGDVVLVSGGGKGIGFECAFGLSQRQRVKLVLLGRAARSEDAELEANLARLEKSGISFHYVRADILNEEDLRHGLAHATGKLGEVTAAIHAAGINRPRTLAQLDECELRATVDTKVKGLRHLLAGLDPKKLKLLVSFGSIIARIGLAGEAHYALANEWLARETASFGERHPHCRCFTLEWSLWRGTGMGERLGRVDALEREGVAPISVDRGVDWFCHELAQMPNLGTVVVAGRFGEPETLRLERPELPFYRFLEKVLVHYPGVELVAECKLSREADPYLDEHVFEGARMFPAAMGMEAAAQAAGALAGDSDTAPTFLDVRWSRPILVPEVGAVRIRIAALAEAQNRIAVRIRSEESGFQVDHFAFTVRFDKGEGSVPTPGWDPGSFLRSIPSHSMEPGKGLYGPLFFHRGRFRRIAAYSWLTAHSAVCEIGSADPSPWFSRFLPGSLRLQDPAALDAAFHGVMGCLPHAHVLPESMGALHFFGDSNLGACRLLARETCRQGDVFVFDLVAVDGAGRCLAQWESVRFRKIRNRSPHPEWPGIVYGAYILRLLRERGVTAFDNLALLPAPDPELSIPQGTWLTGEAPSVKRASCRTGSWLLICSGEEEIGCHLAEFGTGGGPIAVNKGKAVLHCIQALGFPPESVPGEVLALKGHETRITHDEHEIAVFILEPSASRTGLAVAFRFPSPGTLSKESPPGRMSANPGK